MPSRIYGCKHIFFGALVISLSVLNRSQYRLFCVCSPWITISLSLEEKSVKIPFCALYEWLLSSHLPNDIRLCLLCGTCKTFLNLIDLIVLLCQ